VTTGRGNSQQAQAQGQAKPNESANGIVRDGGDSGGGDNGGGGVGGTRSRSRSRVGGGVVDAQLLLLKAEARADSWDLDFDLEERWCYRFPHLSVQVGGRVWGGREGG
jgi:hypothetical protein